MKINCTHLIAQGILPMYSVPDLHQTVADEALYGMQCEVMEEKSGFAHIQMEYGYEGWVKKTALHEGLWPENAVKLRVIKRQLDVMAEPKVNCEILETVPLGAVLVKADDKFDQGLRPGWISVCLVDGRVGYTKTSYFTPYVPLSWEKPEMDEDDLREKLTKAILLYEGTHYRWGGKSPMGIDCSGLCSMAYMLCGIIIYRDASIKEGFCLRSISMDDIKPGDLLFFDGHVAMYLGGERKLYIHSTAKAGSDGVDYNSLDEKDPIYREDLAKGILDIGSIF